MKKLIKKIIDKNGFTVYKNNALPVGTDYRKTIRNLFDINTIKTIFDVGANKGQFCIHCAELF